MKSLDELKKEHQKLIEENNRQVTKLNTVRNKLANISEKILELDDAYVRIECTECNGAGFLKKDDRKVLCSICRGKKYLWLRRYNEDL